MTAFADLANLPEDSRIDAMGPLILKAEKPVAVIVDAELDSAKLNRYVRKLIDRFPGISELDRFPGPTLGAECARMIGPKFVRK